MAPTTEELGRMWRQAQQGLASGLIVTGTPTFTGSMVSTSNTITIADSLTTPVEIPRRTSQSIAIPPAEVVTYEREPKIDRVAREMYDTWDFTPRMVPAFRGDMVPERVANNLVRWNSLVRRIEDGRRPQFPLTMRRIVREHNEATKDMASSHYALYSTFRERTTEKPRFRTIMRELRFIDRSYYWAWRNGRLSILTPCLIIRHNSARYNMGRYWVWMNGSTNVKVRPGGGNLRLGNYIHPNVHPGGGSLCLGDGQDLYRRHYERGALADAFDVVLSILGTYGYRNPYIYLDSSWRRRDEELVPGYNEAPARGTSFEVVEPPRRTPVLSRTMPRVGPNGERPTSNHRCWQCLTPLFDVEAVENRCSYVNLHGPQCEGRMCAHHRLEMEGRQYCSYHAARCSVSGRVAPIGETVTIYNPTSGAYERVHQDYVVQYRPYRRRHSRPVLVTELMVCGRCGRQHMARMDSVVHQCWQRYQRRPVAPSRTYAEVMGITIPQPVLSQPEPVTTNERSADATTAQVTEGPSPHDDNGDARFIRNAFDAASGFRTRPSRWERSLTVYELLDDRGNVAHAFTSSHLGRYGFLRDGRLTYPIGGRDRIERSGSGPDVAPWRAESGGGNDVSGVIYDESTDLPF